MKRLLIIGFFSFVVFALTAQERTVTGTVTSGEDGGVVPGVTVMIKGTMTGTVTDLDGKYTIKVPQSGGTLVFSFVGMKSQEVQITSEMINVVMQTDRVGLDEVIVVGYGTSSKRALTGSIQKIRTESFESNTSANVAVALQGRASGVQITQNSGAPGADVNIRIRGVSSINSGGEPLIVVDGMPGGLSLSDINPNDIESIEILKDASSAAIYGSRAANGVVLVTTKKGSDKTQFTVDYQHGINNPTNLVDIASGPDYLKIVDQAYWNEIPSRKTSPNPNFVLPVYNWDGFTRDIALKTNTDWKDIVTQSAYYDQVSIATGGGTNKTAFYSSLQYRNEYGLSLGNRYQRVTGRINVEHEVSEWLRIGTNISMVYKYTNDAYAGLGDYYTNLLTVYPLYSPARQGKYFYDRNTSGNQGINPLYRQEETWGDDQSLQNFSLGWAELEPLKGLKLRSEWGIKYTGSRSRNYKSREFHQPGDGIDPAQSGSIGYGRYQTYYWNSNNTISYDRLFGDHMVNVLGGVTMDSYFNDGNGLTQEGFPSDYFTLTNANTEIVSTRLSTTVNEFRFLSYIARLKYGYRDRYFAEFQYRRDGSSRFGPDYRWGDFPGGAVSWIATEESFMKGLSWMDYLKVRLSLGTVGNAEIGNYPYLSGLVGWAPFGNTPGFLFNNIGNQTIHWEKQVQTDLGFDYALFKGIVSGSFDYFSKNQNDLIVSNKIGNFHGYFSTNINTNLGDMRTQGFDFNVTTRNLEKNGFKWTTDFNISHFKSVINNLSPSQQWIESGRNIVIEGQPLGAYYLALWSGVDPSTGHEMIYGVNQSLSQNKAATQDDLTGQVLDGNQMPASEFNNQRVVLTGKTPYPDVYGGLGNTVSYKGLELNVLFTYQFGNYIYNDGYQSLMYPTSSTNVSPDLLEGWTPEAPTQTPLIWNSPMSGRGTTRFLYDGSYVRLKNVQLAWYLPKNVLQKLYISNMKIFVLAQNLATWTKYPGQDPEFFNASSGTSANLAPGIDQLGNYPQMRTFTFGVNVSF